MITRLRKPTISLHPRGHAKKSGTHARRHTVRPEGTPANDCGDCDAFLPTILDGLTIGVVTTGLDERLVFANQAACGLIGQSPPRSTSARTLLGLSSSLEELVAAGGKVPHVLPLASVVGTEGLGGVHPGDGTGSLDVELTVHPVEREGVRVGYFILIRDAREDQARSIERARLERLAAIGTMVAGFAHEVRNPVAALRSLAEALEEDLVDANVHVPYVSRMLQVLDRVERLVRTSLQFGRPSAPQRELHRPWTIVADAVAELVPRTRPLGSDMRLSVDADLPSVFVDHDQLIQVLVILANNALDVASSPRGVQIRVTATRRSSDHAPTAAGSPHGRIEGVRFAVIDDGPGIAPELLDRIFDPFYTTKPAGTGLGLSIAQHLISENGGSFAVSSTRGGPTTFSVTVPCARARQE